MEIKVPESGGREERHRIHVAWSPVWSFHSQWLFGLPCHLLGLVHCVFWSPQSTQSSTGHFRALHASFADKVWRCWLHFPADMAPAHTAVKRKMRDTRPTMQMTWRPYQSNLDFHYTGVVTQADCLHATPHWWVIHAKGGQPSIECLEMNILFRSLTFLYKISFFIDLMKYSNFLRH